MILRSPPKRSVSRMEYSFVSGRCRPFSFLFAGFYIQFAAVSKIALYCSVYHTRILRLESWENFIIIFATNRRDGVLAF